MNAASCCLAALLIAAPATAWSQPAQEIRVAYDTYAAGLDVAAVSAAFALNQRSYEMRLAYHTTGLAGLFYHGHQYNTVHGIWDGMQPEPQSFYGSGVWSGTRRLTVIDYRNGEPEIRALLPSNRDERQPVPPDLQAHAMDTLSALALLMRRVADQGRCDASVHTYDGRRATELAAHTVREEMLPRTSRSIYSGPALRCDFEGRMLAGFKLGDDSPADRRPLHGSAWFAAPVPGEPPLPVRMQFETRWFGEATMYLTAAGPAVPQVAEGKP